MKTLHLRTYSIPDGPANTLGHKGLELANRQGEIASLGLDTHYHHHPNAAIGSQRRFGKIFHGPLILSARTALSFRDCLGYSPLIIPIVFGLGDERFFARVNTAAFQAAVQSGMSELSASLKVHSIAETNRWASQGQVVLTEMFNTMADGEIAVGFFDSFTILLAAWSYAATDKTHGVWTRLGPMEGLIFVKDGDNPIYVVRKISVKSTV